MSAPRKRPGRVNESEAKTVGKEDTKSAAKQTAATKQTNKALDRAESEAPQYTPDGRPLAKVQINVSELIPVGNYANVSIGGQASLWIDIDNPDPVTADQLASVAVAGNKIADTLMRDVLGVQRNIVLEVLAEQAKNEGSD